MTLGELPEAANFYGRYRSEIWKEALNQGTDCPRIRTLFDLRRSGLAQLPSYDRLRTMGRRVLESARPLAGKPYRLLNVPTGVAPFVVPPGYWSRARGSETDALLERALQATGNIANFEISHEAAEPYRTLGAGVGFVRVAGHSPRTAQDVISLCHELGHAIYESTCVSFGWAELVKSELSAFLVERAVATELARFDVAAHKDYEHYLDAEIRLAFYLAHLELETALGPELRSGVFHWKVLALKEGLFVRFGLAVAVSASLFAVMLAGAEVSCLSLECLLDKIKNGFIDSLWDTIAREQHWIESFGAKHCALSND